jgi:hypothetical protein
MTTRAPSIVWAYAALAVAFLAANALKWPYGEGLRYPTLLFERVPAQNLAGLVPKGLPLLDQGRLKRSLSRLPAVRLGREVGNSLRIAGGQTLDWVTWGGNETPMLFSDIEFWVSRGLTADREAQIDLVAGSISKYSRRLQKDGWTMVLVPVPTKIGTHRELVRWPLQGPGSLSVAEIREDRSDEVYGHLVARLAEQGVALVNLQAAFRESVARDPRRLLFPPSDSHWSGDGILVAASETARQIARVSLVHARTLAAPTFHEFDYVGDFARAFDPWEGFLSRLRPVWKFRERLLSADAGRAYAHPANPTALIAAVGTSYTGQYTSIPMPVGFAAQIGLHLENAQVQSRALAGKGSFQAFQVFWEERATIAREFETRYGQGHPRIVVWEFPLRDISIIGNPDLPD